MKSVLLYNNERIEKNIIQMNIIFEIMNLFPMDNIINIKMIDFLKNIN